MPSLENKAITHITLHTDTSTQNYPSYVYAKQYDTNSRYLIVSIVDSGNDIAVTGSARLNAVRPDGVPMYIEGTVNADGTVTIGLTQGLLAVDGKIACDITVFDSFDGGQSSLTTSTFFILVDKSNYSLDAIRDEDASAIMADTIAEIKKALELKADGLALDGKMLYLLSGATRLGEAVNLPSGADVTAITTSEIDAICK